MKAVSQLTDFSFDFQNLLSTCGRQRAAEVTTLQAA